VSWVVRVEGGDPDTLEIAATLAQASGIAEIPGYMIVGFDDHAAAAEFADTHGGSVERPQQWGQEALSEVILGSGTITLEVGTAFGHGAHATTALALDALHAIGPGDRRTLLDVGTGTGILSIAAARLGFVSTGCDIDAAAVAIAVRNAERNHVEAYTSFVTASPTQLATPSWLAGSNGFDVIVINALVEVHETEGPAIASLGSSTATIIATGLLGQDQIDRAVSSYAGFRVAGQQDDAPWSLVVLRRTADRRL
jgi:ribosomal protein L11 methyltransferase